MPTRSWPCRRATSSMRYVKPCGTGVFECLVNSVWSSLARAAGVEGPPDRLLADPVDHRRARRLDRGDRRQLFGQSRDPAVRAPPRSGRPAAGSGRSVAGSTLSIAATTSSSGSPASSRRLGVAIAPRPTTPTACASASRSATGLGCKPRRPARPPPRHRGRRARGVDARAGRQVGERRQQQPAVQRRRRRVQRIRQCGIGFAVGSALADRGRAGRAGRARPTRSDASAPRSRIRRTGRRPRVGAQ